MGSFNSRQRNDDGGARGPYWYTPENGLYFGNQFIMGGQEFPALDPESFLFGGLGDLNHLSRLPGVLNQAPPNIKHTNTIRSLVCLHKESLKLIHHTDTRAETNSTPTTDSHLEFSFDSDVNCEIIVHFFATESSDSNRGSRYSSKISWPAKRYGPGMMQKYSHPTVSLKLGSYTADELLIENCGPRVYPIVIEIKAEVDHNKPHVHSTLATFEGSPESLESISVKPVVQRLSVDGLTLVLKEIYGIERQEEEEPADEFGDDNTECVVCMSDTRDTMALPCRHLCLCNPCAEVLRYQANKCPICRAPFHSLLQIRVLRRDDGTREEEEEERDEGEGEDEVPPPPGFKHVSIVSALRENPNSSTMSPSVAAENIENGDSSGADADKTDKTTTGEQHTSTSTKVIKVEEVPATTSGGGDTDLEDGYLAVGGTEGGGEPTTSTSTSTSNALAKKHGKAKARQSMEDDDPSAADDKLSEFSLPGTPDSKDDRRLSPDSPDANDTLSI